MQHHLYPRTSNTHTFRHIRTHTCRNPTFDLLGCFWTTDEKTDHHLKGKSFLSDVVDIRTPLFPGSFSHSLLLSLSAQAEAFIHFTGEHYGRVKFTTFPFVFLSFCEHLRLFSPGHLLSHWSLEGYSLRELRNRENIFPSSTHIDKHTPLQPPLPKSVWCVWRRDSGNTNKRCVQAIPRPINSPPPPPKSDNWCY